MRHAPPFRTQERGRRGPAAARRGGGRGRGRGRRQERERRHRGSGGGGGGAFRFRKRAPRTIQHSNASESGSSSFATSAQIPFLFVAAEDVPGTRNYLIRKFRDSESVLQESCNRFWNCTKTFGLPMFSMRFWGIPDSVFYESHVPRKVPFTWEQPSHGMYYLFCKNCLPRCMHVLCLRANATADRSHSSA